MVNQLVFFKKIHPKMPIDPFLRACSCGNLESVQEIFNAAKIFAVAEDLLGCADSHGDSPLHLAVIGGHTNVVDFLIKNGANMYKLNCYNTYPFEHACKSVVCHTFNLENFRQLLAVFKQNGFDINHTRGKHDSYLSIFVQHHLIDPIAILLEYGADINIKDSVFETTPLHDAAHQDPHMVEWLVEHGADLGAVDYFGRTPLDCAKSSLNDIDINNTHEKLPLIITYLQQQQDETDRKRLRK